MSYIPPGSKWYLAEIVEEFRISGEHENVVHTNLVLVRADSPEEAFECATELGRQANRTYTNPKRQVVTVNYRGLRDLNVIHGELQHGTELIFEERTGMTEAELDALVSAKEELGVFQSNELSLE